MKKLKVAAISLICLFICVIVLLSVEGGRTQEEEDAGTISNDIAHRSSMGNPGYIGAGRSVSFRSSDFRGDAAGASARGDVNADGISDIIFRNASTGASVLWFMRSDGTMASAKTLFTAANSTIVGAGDFNGDGICDLIRRDMDTGRTTICLRSRQEKL